MIIYLVPPYVLTEVRAPHIVHDRMGRAGSCFDGRRIKDLINPVIVISLRYVIELVIARYANSSSNGDHFLTALLKHQCL